MPTTIKCPKCSHEFPLEEAVSEEYKKELREQMVSYKKQKDEEFSRKELEWKQQLEENLRKNISSDFENKLRMLEHNNKDNEEKLKEARQQQLQFLKKEQELKNKEEKLELSLQKKLQSE